MANKFQSNESPILNLLIVAYLLKKLLQKMNNIVTANNFFVFNTSSRQLFYVF